jgi:adenine phosphoribosyltransferase
MAENYWYANLRNSVEEKIRNVPDFPKEGIQFKDITPIFKDANLFEKLMSYYVSVFKGEGINKIVCIDARGFIFGSVLASKMGIPFVVARKAGKLPAKTISHTYNLEYGEATLEMHMDDIKSTDNVLIVDDLLATGGTIDAVVNLVQKLGGTVHGCWFLIELSFLEGRSKIIKSVSNYDVKFYSLLD